MKMKTAVLSALLMMALSTGTSQAETLPADSRPAAVPPSGTAEAKAARIPQPTGKPALPVSPKQQLETCRQS